jgi:copper chaperone NosL
MNNKLQPVTRIITLLCTIALVAVLFLPLWRIELDAPQYPEGLVLVIHPHGLEGDVEVVNGLNHYIGMRTLHNEDFIEFTILPYIIGAFAFFGLLTWVINRKWFFTVWTLFFVAFGIIAMVDFYRWEYNYGHNLDPTAPIQIPGMSYQPPLIGFKQLLNFGAYSIPDAGGWIFVAVGLALAVTLFLELRRTVKITRKLEIKTVGTVAMMVMIMSSCSAQPEPLKMGVDACDFCKMTLTDPKFGAELITKKGRISRFDDTQCLTGYMSREKLSTAELKSIWLVDYAGNGQFVEAEKAILLKSEKLRSPMGGNVAAFSTHEKMEAVKKNYPGEILSWKDLSK